MMNISRQAVFHRLQKAGIATKHKTIPRETLVNLYVRDTLPVSKIAKELRTTSVIVKRELDRYGIKQRPKNSRVSAMDGMLVGDTVKITANNYAVLYGLAKVRGFTVSLSREGEAFRVTRVS